MGIKKTIFDKTVFKNNLQKTWHVSATAMLILYLTMILPIMLNVLSQPGDPQFDVEVLECLRDNFIMAKYVAMGMAALLAVILFLYLQKSRSVSFYHSLPISRDGLFVTNIVSALVIMYLPNIMISVVMFIQVKGMGYSAFSEIMVWLLVLCAEELFYFSLAILCMMLCGNEIISVVAYAILIFAPEYIFTFLSSILTAVAYGYGSDEISIVLNKFSPEHRYDGILLKIWQEPKGDSFTVHHEFVGLGSTLAVSLAITLVLFVVAFIVYKRRKSETAGDFISAGWFKPIAAAGVAIILAMMTTSLLISGLVDESVTRYSDTVRVIIVISLAFVGFVGYLAVKLIAGKHQSALGKSLISSLIFTVFMVILGFGILFLSDRIEKYTPDADDVKSVKFTLVIMDANDNFDPEHIIIEEATDKEGIKEIIELNKKAASGKENWLLYGKSKGYENVLFSYTLKENVIVDNLTEQERYIYRIYQTAGN